MCLDNYELIAGKESNGAGSSFLTKHQQEDNIVIKCLYMNPSWAIVELAAGTRKMSGKTIVKPIISTE